MKLCTPARGTRAKWHVCACETYIFNRERRLHSPPSCRRISAALAPRQRAAAPLRCHAVTPPSRPAVVPLQPLRRCAPATRRRRADAPQRKPTVAPSQRFAVAPPRRRHAARLCAAEPRRGRAAAPPSRCDTVQTGNALIFLRKTQQFPRGLRPPDPRKGS